MPGNRGCTVYVGNLDEKVSDRVLYEILIQAGRLVGFHIPRDKETNRAKGYAFAEYESEEIAEYAVRLFSGLVILCNRALKFAIAGQDKPSPNLSTPVVSDMKQSPKPRSYPVRLDNMEPSRHLCRFSEHSINYAQVPPASPGMVQPNGYGSDFNGSYNYSKRFFGATLDSITRSNSNHRLYDFRSSSSYSSH